MTDLTGPGREHLQRLLKEYNEYPERQKAIEEQAAAVRVPPSMYRTTEPPLPEPDFSLPVADVPRSTPSPSPAAGASPQPGQ